MKMGKKRRYSKSKEESEKGLSPVIATVMLITIVIVIAVIVFLWIRGMTQEAITKFSDPPQNIQLVCEQVSFDSSYTTENGLAIMNPGTIPIFGMNVKVVGAGSHETIDLRTNPNWPEVGLNQGAVFSDSEFADNITISGATQIVLIPVLIGDSKSGRKTYACDEGQYGTTIEI